MKKPENAEFDGASLMPLITDHESPWPERTLFVHNQRVDFPEKYKDYQVLTERWRLIKRQTEELYDIQKDPGQRFDVAAQNPEVVKALHRDYEEWWEDISRDFDKYDEIIIGSERENPAILYSHDAHSKNSNRVWVIHVERDGEYEFKASRWPEEANKLIAENREGDINPDINQAHLSIGNIQSAIDVTPDMKFARFLTYLKAGTTSFRPGLVKLTTIITWQPHSFPRDG